MCVYKLIVSRLALRSLQNVKTKGQGFVTRKSTEFFDNLKAQCLKNPRIAKLLENYMVNNILFYQESPPQNKKQKIIALVTFFF